MRLINGEELGCRHFQGWGELSQSRKGQQAREKADDRASGSAQGAAGILYLGGQAPSEATKFSQTK